MPDVLSVRLCYLVQQRPELYDIFNERFHDEVAKKSAWRDIAYWLDVPQSECEIRWKKIRHQFVKAKKEQDTTWDLWPCLRFLKEAEARSIPGKSPRKGKASISTADSPSTPHRSTRKGRVSEASTTTADSPGVSSLADDPVIVLTKSTLDKAIYSKQVQPATALLTEVFSGKHDGSSEASEPPLKRLRTDRSGVGAYSQQSRGTEWGAVLDEKFLQQLENKLAKLRPEVRWTMKSTILKMLDDTA